MSKKVKVKEKAKKEGADTPEIKRTVQTTRWLKYEFSDGEKILLAGEIARKHIEAGHLEKKKQEITKRFAAEIAAADSVLGELSSKINDGHEYRDVECEKVLDYSTGTVTVVRKDTAEVVEERPMQDEEKQPELPGAGGNGEGEEAPPRREWTLEEVKEADHLCIGCVHEPESCGVGVSGFRTAGEVVADVPDIITDKVLECTGFKKREE